VARRCLRLPAECVEDAGVISGWRGARIELAKVGLPLTAFVHLRCLLGRCSLKTAGQ